MRRVSAVLLAVLILELPAAGVQAQTTGGAASGNAAAAPKAEFPQWVRDLRRGEIIAFGAFPFTLFFTTSIWEAWKWGHYDGFSWDNRRYAPWPFKPAGAERLDNDEFLAVMGIAAGTAVVLAITDHLLVRRRRNRAAREAARLPSGTVRIERSPWPETAPPAGEGAEGNSPAGAADAEAPAGESP